MLHQAAFAAQSKYNLLLNNDHLASLTSDHKNGNRAFRQPKQALEANPNFPVPQPYQPVVSKPAILGVSMG
jgi:hypothetical protein